MQETKRKIDDKEVAYRQVVQIVRKVEVETLNDDGTSTNKVSFEPLFVVLMANKTTTLYEELWGHFNSLFEQFYGEKLEPG